MVAVVLVEDHTVKGSDSWMHKTIEQFFHALYCCLKIRWYLIQHINELLFIFRLSKNASTFLTDTASNLNGKNLQRISADVVKAEITPALISHSSLPMFLAPVSLEPTRRSLPPQLIRCLMGHLFWELPPVRGFT